LVLRQVLKFSLLLRKKAMRKYLLPVVLMGWMTLLHAQVPTIAEKTKGLQPNNGFFTYYYDQEGGKIWLEVEQMGEEVLYINSLTAGLGSNDIGLDRNQLGDTRVVRFIREGQKVLLQEPNLKFRARTQNLLEQQSVEEAFAQSVLWGFKVEAEESGKVLIDWTPFLMRDAHGVAERLKERKQGDFTLDEALSILWLDRTRSFPENTEFEALLTFTGTPRGQELKSVAPTPASFSVRMHHSLVQLPDDGFEPRVYDPRSGYFPLTFQDYAAPIDAPLTQRLIYRHRLEKANPKAKRSRPVEPIVYYLDRGVPEPIRSALLEGAGWWNEAFEVAGFIDAFQVKVLPEGADPMDVRYNIINWVHRSTRGWSYGTTVADPRTGEILKGHVLLGSLRVRQDFLIAQGLIEAYESGEVADPRLKEMALARLRQLSAHEVGHTLGLAHNFAASINNRASVMDYPHPLLQLGQDGAVDFSKAYDTGIGAWDKLAIRYGYTEFSKGTDVKKALNAILMEGVEAGLHYISDDGARSDGTAHPLAHLWDNGTSASEELNRIMDLRREALSRFGEANIPEGQPMSTLERVLTPLYLSHRYQVAACSKLLGGYYYTYALRGDGQPVILPVPEPEQSAAMTALLRTVKPSELVIPADILNLIPPQPVGYSRGREYFEPYTGTVFDPMAAAESAIDHTLSLMLHPQRLARMVNQEAQGDLQSIHLDRFVEALWKTMDDAYTPAERAITRVGQKRLILHLLRLAGDDQVAPQVAGAARYQVDAFERGFGKRLADRPEREEQAHLSYMLGEIKKFKAAPSAYHLPKASRLPDGSPIGCGH
jgi:hypothetical protein